MKGKEKYIKLLPVLLIVIAFFIITDQFQEKERTSFAVDEEAFDVAKDESELRDKLNGPHLYGDPNRIKLMEKYDLITKIDDVSVDLMEERRNFRIESVWNEHIQLLITYSFDLSPFDKSPEDIPYLEVDRIKFHSDGRKALELPVQNLTRGNLHNFTGEGVVYKNRLYRQMWIEPNMDEETWQSMNEWLEDNPYEGIANINAFELGDIQFIHKSKDGSEESVAQTEDIAINYDFKGYNTLLEKVPINQTVDLGKETEITFKDLEIRLNENWITLDINSPYDFAHLNFRMNDRLEYSSILMDQNNKVMIRLHLSNSGNLNLADEYTFEVLNGMVLTDDEVKGTITKEELKVFREQLENGKNSYDLNKSIGTVNNVDFEFAKLEKTTHMPSEMNHGFFLTVEQDEDYQRLHFSNYTEYQEFVKQHPDAIQYRSNEPFIEVTNEKGEPVKFQSGFSERSSQFFGTSQKEFERHEELNIRLFNIPKKIDFAENEVTFKLNE